MEKITLNYKEYDSIAVDAKDYSRAGVLEVPSSKDFKIKKMISVPRFIVAAVTSDRGTRFTPVFIDTGNMMLYVANSKFKVLS